MPIVQHATIIIERQLKAPPARVFAAWSSQTAKRSWFAEGEGWKVLTFELDFREGGTETSRFAAPDGVEHANETVFHDIVANERIIFAYSMLMNGVRHSVSLATIDVRPDGAGTRLIFTEQGAFFEGGDGPKMREMGWNELLNALAKHLGE